VTFAFLAAALAALAPTLPARAQNLAVRGETVYTMAGQPIKDGVVVVTGGKVAQVGPAGKVTVPAGYKTLTAKVVTPGLIDAHSTVGLSGYLNQPHDQMQLDKSAAIQPELRAVDAYDARERLIEWVRGFGVTTLHTGHGGPGALVPGQTMIVKTWGETVEKSLVRPEAMVAVNLGEAGLTAGGSPGTRAKQIALLRAELLKAQEYADKQSAKSGGATPPARDLRAEEMARVLRGEVPLLVTAHRATDIAAALRLRREFPTLKVVLDGASEAFLMTEEIKAAGLPVVLHPTMYRAGGDAENLSMETASVLREAGIPFALQSGFEGYVPKTRVVLFEAALAAANGLTFEEALAAVTRDAARVLGVADRVGTIEPGRDGDLALYDGDPFEYTTHCVGTVVGGQVAAEGSR
jgi:imidazolonepropionase-like amidohydrolase